MIFRKPDRSILIYYNPFIEFSNPDYSAWPIVHLYSTLCAYFKNQNYKIIILTGSHLKKYIDQDENYQNIQCIYVDHVDLLSFTSSGNHFKMNSYLSPREQDQKEMIIFLKKYFAKDFYPEIILTYLNSVPFLKTLFPKSKVFHNEIGWGSENSIYNLSFYFDHKGILEQSYLFKSYHAIKEFPLNEDHQRVLARIKKEVYNRYDYENPYVEWISELRKKFKKIYLLAGSGGYDYFHCQITTGCTTLLDVILKTMKKIPLDYCVILTLHPSYQKNLITDSMISYLNKYYPNLILFYNGVFFQSHSERLLILCDGLIVGESKLIHDALFLNKPFYCIKTSAYQLFSSKNIENLKPSPYSPHLIFWLFSRYFLFQNDFLTSTVLNNKFFHSENPIYSLDQMEKKLFKQNDELMTLEYLHNKFFFDDHDCIKFATEHYQQHGQHEHHRYSYFKKRPHDSDFNSYIYYVFQNEDLKKKFLLISEEKL